MDNTPPEAPELPKADRDFIPANAEQVPAGSATAPDKMLPFGLLEVSRESHDPVVFVFYFKEMFLKYPMADLMILLLR